MRNRHLLIILFITSVSLIGLLTIQYLWINKAMKLNEDQLNHRIILALQNTRDILASGHTQYQGWCSALSDTADASAERTIPADLDHLIVQEFQRKGFEKKLRYGIIDLKNNRIIPGKDAGEIRDLANTSFRIELPCGSESSRYFLSVVSPVRSMRLSKQLWLWISLTAGFMLIISAVFLYTVRMVKRQKKLSDIKNDFVNNMTHEFKTPIATISIASEMLMKSHIFNEKEKAQKYVRIIFDENVRMMHQVEQVLQIAMIDKENFRIRPVDCALHEIIRKCASSAELTVKKGNGKIDLLFNAINDHIIADTVHLSNIINNLIDNAIKYSPEGPRIEIATHNTNDGIIFSVEDKGLGISREDQRQVFKKFYRVSTGDVHDVKGFGLGLYYVKTIVDAHGGYINLYSEPGKGSRFEVFLPFINNIG